MKYSEFVTAMSHETGIPESLLYAVIHTESSFNPEVDSHLGARGLMQLTEETFDWVMYRKKADNDYHDLYQPETNIRYGAWLLELLSDEFKNDDAVLSAYHAGWGSVKSWLGTTEYSADGSTLSVIPSRNTSHYVYKVKRAQKLYQWLYRLN